MKTAAENNTNRHYLILVTALLTGLICIFSWGISGNDFWWHVKAGEWMVNNQALPSVDVFSWYAKERGIVWVSHEWLSQVIFYLIHHLTGDIGIVIFSLISAVSMTMLIVLNNQQAIKSNIILATIYIAPSVMMYKFWFYGRPHLISFFLLYATLSCLYKYKEDPTSRAIYSLPFISILWGNLHGGSSTLLYILCFIFGVSGLLELSIGKLHGEKLSNRQLKTFFGIGFLSIAALAVNPYGLEMLIYPYANMGDSFPQEVINEWFAPDAKMLLHLIVFYLPLLVVGGSMIITDKKIKVVDLLIFVFFSYMAFRSIRFAIVFFIVSTFFTFNYFIPRNIKSIDSRPGSVFFHIILVILFGFNIFSVTNTIKTMQEGKLISEVLDRKFLDLLKIESPKRLFNDYDFGEVLIHNGFETFIDARADLFSPHNLRDTRALLTLQGVNNDGNSKIFDPEKVIARYNFDAFLIRVNNSLAAFLKSHPESYKILLEDGNAVYFKRLQRNSFPGAE